MRNIIIILLLVAFFGSCNIQNFLIPDMDTVDEIDAYINTVLQYQADTIPHCQTYTESINRGYGDCEDFAIMKICLLDWCLHEYYDKAFCKNKINGRYHSVLYKDGLMICPYGVYKSWYLENIYDVVSIMKHDTVMALYGY